MTDTPPPHQPDEAAADTPAEKAKRKRTRLELAAFIAGMVVAGLLALTVILTVGGRMYLVSDPGRELITSFVAGKKISRYGRINVEGLQGDLFDDFRLKRVTITDAKGCGWRPRTFGSTGPIGRCWRGAFTPPRSRPARSA
ncbi:hypothetical protein [Brevundimonas naejangsanensis]|uniref:hypothetical protein n=1 Tax=Brevundimonas naejangsanensis TaxID=588932 RepID=UPI001F08BEA0|nr:hypothetical protein [Brevundimonas naejangsanensis]